jgi:hypothetical protein
MLVGSSSTAAAGLFHLGQLPRDVAHGLPGVDRLGYRRRKILRLERGERSVENRFRRPEFAEELAGHTRS